MARAKRHYLPGHIWHITHRCHKRELLLRFSKDRHRYLQWLYEAKKRYGEEPKARRRARTSSTVELNGRRWMRTEPRRTDRTMKTSREMELLLERMPVGRLAVKMVIKLWFDDTSFFFRVRRSFSGSLRILPWRPQYSETFPAIRGLRSHTGFPFPWPGR